MVQILLKLSIDSCSECPKYELSRCTINNKLVTLSYTEHPNVPDWCPAKVDGINIEVGQIWKHNELFYHVPVQDKTLLSQRTYKVIRCDRYETGWRWIFPRTQEDEPIWKLEDFKRAELIEESK